MDTLYFYLLNEYVLNLDDDIIPNKKLVNDLLNNVNQNNYNKKKSNKSFDNGRNEFNMKITDALLREYKTNNVRPNDHALYKITLKIVLTPKQVYDWFQMRRNKLIIEKNKLDNQIIIEKPQQQIINDAFNLQHINDWFLKRKYKLKVKKYDLKAIQILLEKYEKNKYPDQHTINRIASKIGLTSKQVQKWFLNRRHKLKVKQKL